MGFKILCDFDGTITIDDVSLLVLEEFAKGDWRQYEDALENAKINVEECLNLQFRFVKTPKQQIIDIIKNKIIIREGFLDLIDFGKTNDIEVIILSAGLDFIIDHVLRTRNLKIPVIGPTSHFNDGISFTFPSRKYKNSVDFKLDTVIKLQEQGFQTIFIGDGGSDYNGAMKSNHVFAVRNKHLEKFLSLNGKIGVKQFESFKEILVMISEIIS